jgi:Bacterial Ig-like domain (group 3)/FG-GAP-like repeat
VLTSGGSTVTTVNSGKVVTLTASVYAGAASVTTGQVNFCDASAKYSTDIHLFGTAQLTPSGSATLKLRPGIGAHSFKAVFLGTNSAAASFSGTSALTVSGLRPTITSLVQTGNEGNYTLTATTIDIINAPGIPAPTGTISFVDTSKNNSILGTASVDSGTRGLTFFNSKNLTMALEGNAVAVADFNGDGIPDLAVSDDASGQPPLDIFLGKGDGSFIQTAVSPTVGKYPAAIAVGDFNRDGIVDLAVSSTNDNNVTILLGVGDGTFNSAPDLLTLATPRSVVVGTSMGMASRIWQPSTAARS